MVRKQKNLARQETLRKEREEEAGDPVRGITTPFVESFDTGVLTAEESAAEGPADAGETSERATEQQAQADAKLVDRLLSERQLNFHIKREEVLEAMKRPPYAVYRPNSGDEAASEADMSNDERFKNNAVAVARILNLRNGSSMDLLTHNKRRCIEAFGRHNTDNFLPPKPPSLMTAYHESREREKRELQQLARKRLAQGQQAEQSADPSDSSVEIPEETSSGSAPAPAPAVARAGPDTGSSEVQIAILTAKIRALATALEREGRQDKMNKRNLRVLVHRRQKLLRYLRRKERGGPRWQHLVEKLGLTEGTWNGEISL